MPRPHARRAFLFLLVVLALGGSAAAAAPSVLILVRSTIGQDGKLTRDVIASSTPEILFAAQAEFLGEDTSGIRREDLPDNRTRLSRTYTDLEDCAGLMLDGKDLVFSDRFQIRQSLPRFRLSGAVGTARARFEFTLPFRVIKMLRDRQATRGATGNTAVLEVPLDKPGNIDLFFERPRPGPLAVLVIVLIGLFLTPKVTPRFNRVLLPLLAVLTAMVLAGVVILLIGESPISAAGAMVAGSCGSLTNLANVLLNATPLVFSGLAVAFAFQAGLFNIGGESQIMVGAFAAGLIGLWCPLPGLIHLPMAVAGAGIAAALYASIAGWLKSRFHVHEVISTIMLNYIGFAWLGFLVMLPGIKENGPNPQSGEILATSILPTFTPRHGLNWGVFLAVATAAGVWFLLYRTTFGFKIRSVGLNEAAAENSGIDIRTTILLAMAISGALAGLAGAERVLGVVHKYNNMAFVGYGFDGIAVALLVNNHPLAILPSALLFGFLKSGGAFMNREIGVPVELVVIVQAVIVFFMAAEKIVRNLYQLGEGE